MKKFFTTTFCLRIGRNDCRNIINLIVHRRINRNGGFDRNPNTQRNQTLS